MIRLRIRESKRTFRCDVSGCRNRTHFLIAKRDDVNSKPLHLCRECIRGLGVLLDEIDGVDVRMPTPDEPDTAPETTIITVNVGDRSGEETPETAEETPEEPTPAPTRRRRTTK